MNLKKLFFVACNVFGLISFAQVGINTTTPNAQLDIRATSATTPSNTDGLLIPKIDVFPTTNPTADQQGMLVYLTTTVGAKQPGFYYWDNPTTTFIGIGGSTTGNNWALAGNTVNATTDFMGSTNDADVIFKRNNIRAGRLGTYNTSFGNNSLNSASSVISCTAIGSFSLEKNLNGYWNTGIGAYTLYNNTSGEANVANGISSMYYNTSGSYNTASGSLSLGYNTTGSYNTASGNDALRNNATGSNNTGLGYNTQTGTNLTNATAIGANASATTSNSLVLGSISGTNGATASAKVGIGTTAPNAALEVKAVNPAAPTNTEGLLIPRINVFPATNPTAAQQGMLVYLTTTSGSNAPGFYYWDNPTTTWIGLGKDVKAWQLSGNTVNAATDFMGSTNNADVIFKRNNVRAGRIGIENTSFGVYALNPASTGSQNTASGTSSLFSNTTGINNTATGFSSLYSNTSGYSNTASGTFSLQNNTTGFYNTASGTTSLYSNTSGYSNTASGTFSLENNTTGYHNTASGSSSLNANTTGYANTASGVGSLQYNTKGGYNTASGYYSLQFNTTSYNNTASGFYSLRYNTTGNSNTASGTNSLYSNSTGDNNTASGFSSLSSNTTGSQNTAIGYNAFSSGVNFSNSTALGANTSITASNQVRLGNNAVTSIGGQVSWTTLSDARFKTENAAKVPGIDFIKKLRPVTYYVNHEAMNRYLEVPKGKDGTDRTSANGQNTYKPEYEKSLESGFMAQEVEQAAKELGYEFNGVDAPKNEKDYYGLRYSQFVVPLVKAVQELNEKVEQKQAENDQLKAMLLELEKRIDKLEKNK